MLADLKTKLDKSCFDKDFFDFCCDKIDEEYKNADTICNFIEEIYNKYKDSEQLKNLILKLLVEKNRTKIVNFIVTKRELCNTLHVTLLKSKFYQHRLALIELFLCKDIQASDKTYIQKLLDDKVTLVVKQAIKCVKKELFTDIEILEILVKLYNNDAYIISGSCPFLLTQIKDIQKVKPWCDKLVTDESWLVRYNLCKCLNLINHENEFEYSKRFASDEIAEIRSLFCTVIKDLKIEENRFVFYKQMLNDKDEKIRNVCVKEVEKGIDCTNQIYIVKYCLFMLKSLVDDSYLETRVKTCEIFAKNMARVLHKNDDTTSCLYDYFNKEISNSKGDTMGISDVYTQVSDFCIVLPFIESFLSDKNWRIREKCAGILKELGKVSKEYITNNLLYFHISLLNDQVHEIRNKGLDLLKTFIKEYGTEIVLSYSEEIKKMASNEKYAIRLLSINILSIIAEYEINEKVLGLLLDIIEILIKDNLCASKSELMKVLIKFDKFDWYDDKIFKFIMQLGCNEKGELKEIVIK